MTLLRYLVVGCLNTVLGYGLIYAAMYFLQFPVLEANALGYAGAVLVGFALNRRWTFASQDHALGSLIRYFAVLAVAYGANLAMVMYAVEGLALDHYWAQATGAGPYVLIGFLGSRYYAFRGRRRVSALAVPEVAPEPDPLPLIHRPIDLSIVVPCYNEEAVLPETMRRLSGLLEKLMKMGMISTESCVVYVDDGSRDGTWRLIESLAARSPWVRGIKLSRNRGHQNALLAGLFTAEGEAVITVDADLQDDLLAIERMIELYVSGREIVYGVRKSRHSDTFFKRFSAQLYYRVLQMMGVEIIYNHADYRLMGRAAIEALREFQESNLFLRGIIPQLGFPFGVVYYDRAERFAGESKYPLRKMLSLAWQGVTSFSTIPLRLITGLGILMSLGSLLVTVWIVWIKLFTDRAVPGWASIVVPIYTLGGIQLLCLGIMGEYLAKIYTETKRRPRYVIEKTVGQRPAPHLRPAMESMEAQVS